MKKQTTRRISLALLFITVIAVYVAWWQRLAIYDWVRLYNYTPPTQVVALADRTTMNGSTRRLFYVNRPAIEDKTQFNNDCKDSEQTIVLGCYVPNQGIYLYNIHDPRLNGIVEVTAAHETLHAAYDRLSPAERSKVDQMTALAFSQVTDDRIKKTVQAYRDRDPRVVPSELHSILGTEVRQLPPELEQYYSRYFQDRGAIVAYSEKYQKVFSERQTQIEQYGNRLQTLKQQIDNLESAMTTLSDSIRAQKAAMDAELAAKQYDQYNAQVNSYNAKVKEYNAKVNTDQNLIDQYNQLVASRNALVYEESQLVKAIDSRPTTVQTQ